MKAAGPLWRASFLVDDGPLPAVMELLDGEGESVSAFEHAGDGGLQVERWRIEILYAQEPDRKALRRRIVELVRNAGAEPEAWNIDLLPPEDWLSIGPRVFEPVHAGRFVVHGANARDRVPPDRIGIEIEAGLAFGSGEHATTKGCLHALDRHLSRSRALRNVLDLGCGTGVLGIAAAKAAPLRAVLSDNDPVAVRIAVENAAKNGVRHRIEGVVADGLANARLRRRGRFDLVLANILADPLCAMARDIARVLRPRGRAVLSGLIVEQARRVSATFHLAGLPLRERHDDGAWTVLVVGR